MGPTPAPACSCQHGARAECQGAVGSALGRGEEGVLASGPGGSPSPLAVLPAARRASAILGQDYRNKWIRRNFVPSCGDCHHQAFSTCSRSHICPFLLPAVPRPIVVNWQDPCVRGRLEHWRPWGGKNSKRVQGDEGLGCWVPAWPCPPCCRQVLGPAMRGQPCPLRALQALSMPSAYPACPVHTLCVLCAYPACLVHGLLHPVSLLHALCMPCCTLCMPCACTVFSCVPGCALRALCIPCMHPVPAQHSQLPAAGWEVSGSTPISASLAARARAWGSQAGIGGSAPAPCSLSRCFSCRGARQGRAISARRLLPLNVVGWQISRHCGTSQLPNRTEAWGF